MRFLPCFWSSLLIVIGIFSIAETASLIIFHGSLDNFTETPLEEPLKIVPFMSKNLVTMIYIFGYSENRYSEGPTVILSAYLTTHYTNVILLDWSEEAKVNTRVSALFSYVFGAVPNSRRVGRKLGLALMALIQNGVSANTIHVVGHSLGAHVAGCAGEYLKGQGITIWRITGLDPAGPMFQEPAIMGGLRSSSAKFVDVLRTNPNLYGNRNLLGSVDFWANCNDTVQPGCPDDTTLDDSDSFCSHRRSYLLFAESILSPTGFPAVKAESCNEWQHKNTSSQIIYLGDMIDSSARGVFFFSTRDHQPFSKDQAGLVPNT